MTVDFCLLGMLGLKIKPGNVHPKYKVQTIQQKIIKVTLYSEHLINESSMKASFNFLYI